MRGFGVLGRHRGEKGPRGEQGMKGDKGDKGDKKKEGHVYVKN